MADKSRLLPAGNFTVQLVDVFAQLEAMSNPLENIRPRLMVHLPPLGLEPKWVVGSQEFQKMSREKRREWWVRRVRWIYETQDY